jgi:hypothetical protein
MYAEMGHVIIAICAAILNNESWSTAQCADVSDLSNEKLKQPQMESENGHGNCNNWLAHERPQANLGPGGGNETD